MKVLLASLMFIVTTTQVEWLENFDQAKEIAKHDHKFILLNFSGSDWCGPCVKMKKEVFENPSFLLVAEDKLVLVRADFPRLKKNQLSKEQVQHNEMLAEQYNKQGKFPYTILLDANGAVLKEWDGYVFGSQDKFVSELTATLASLN